MFERVEIASTRRPWTTVVSFVLEAIAIGIVLMLPLLYPATLPAFRATERIIAPRTSAPVRTVTIIATERGPAGAAAQGSALEVPRTIPTEIDMTPDPVAPRLAEGPVMPVGSIPGGHGPENLGPVGELIASAAARPNPAPPARPSRLRVSSLDSGTLIRRVQPVYPVQARNIRVQGPVVLAAVIDAGGEIAHLRVLQGHPMLAGAAIEAVRQWRYRPYLLNGSPIEVETQITVVFTLGR
ncbi:MAG TPA: energy transducer TonB [Clostridia bacterium]|nr:energy transducer TonB [Clostridia bacterium]